jgi:hypothetical protein
MSTHRFSSTRVLARTLLIVFGFSALLPIPVRSATFAALKVRGDLAVGIRPQISLNPTNGRPRICYTNQANTRMLAEWTGTSWVTSAVPENDPWVFETYAFDHRPDGSPAFAHYGGNIVQYLYRQGTQWSVDESINGNGNIPHQGPEDPNTKLLSLAYDPTTGFPAIAYRSGKFGFNADEIRFTARSAGGWLFDVPMSTGDDPLETAFWDVSLTFGSDGKPYIAFISAPPIPAPVRLRVAYENPGIGDFFATEEVTTNIINRVAIGVSNGIIEVVYNAADVKCCDWLVVYADNAFGKWNPIVVDRGLPGTVNDISFVVDSEGGRHIGYSLVDANGTIMQKYAYAANILAGAAPNAVAFAIDTVLTAGEFGDDNPGSVSLDIMPSGGPQLACEYLRPFSPSDLYWAYTSATTRVAAGPEVDRGLRIYPSPCQAGVPIRLALGGTGGQNWVKAEVIDVQGRRRASISGRGAQFLETKTLDAGVYVVRATSETGESFTGRVAILK